MAFEVVVPVGDVNKYWSYPASGTHFDDIDEGSGGPDANYIEATEAAGDDDDIDSFEFADPDFEGGTASQVVIYTNGLIIGSNQPEIQIIIAEDDSGLVNVALTTSQTWKTNILTPSGDDWTELEATSLKVIYQADVPTSKDENTIFTCYAVFSYTAAPVGWGHKFLGVPAANIGSVNGVLRVNIAKIKGV